MDRNSSMKQWLDSLMTEMKPILDIKDLEERTVRIHTLFANKSLTPTKYKGLMQIDTFAVWIVDETLQEIFRCTKIWIELIDDPTKLLDKIYDLRDILSHEWMILVIDQKATYTIFRPLIWAKVQGLKRIVAQM